MKKATLFTRLLCLALVAFMTFGLCACPAGEPTGTSGTSSSTTGSGNQNPNPGDVTDVIYGNGPELKGAGASLAEDAYALNVGTPDTANAVEMTASEFVVLFRRTGPEAGKTYRITDGQPVVFSGSSRSYDGMGAYLIAPAGVMFDGATDATLTSLTVIGPIIAKNCKNVTLLNAGAINEGNIALTVEPTAVGFSAVGCHLAGSTAVFTTADSTTVMNSVLRHTALGVRDEASVGTTVVNCVISGEGDGIRSSSAEAYIRDNTLDLTTDAVGISVSGTTVNVLVALNEIKGAQSSVVLEGALNASVILNRAVTLYASNCTAVYLCDNALGGRLRVQGNDYILADGNTFAEDGLDHTTLQADNTNTNGDSLMDVDARLEVGADEDLLPHNFKDLFLTMERKTSVKVGSYIDGSMEAGDYLINTKAENGYVILAPGAYAVTHDVGINASHNGTTFYGYGALLERAKSSDQNLGRHFAINGATKVTLKGITVGYERQSCGQVYVLEKLSDNRVLVVTGAGMDNEFGNTDTSLYNITGMGAQRMGTFYAYCDTFFNSISKRNDGFMEMSLDSSVYQMLAVGDILTCRSEQGHVTFTIDNSRDVYFRDVTNYGCSGSYAFVEGNNRTATTYYRVANITKNGPIISEEEYNRYKALEEEYGVSLEVSIDEEGRYRGSLPHIGSIDATHTAGCAQGSVAISCIFENMCDDATNQRHNHARVDEIIDNGDGTTTIVYKGNYPKLQYDNGDGGAGIVCRPFIKGDRVYIYTGVGQLVCDTTALSATTEYKIRNEQGQTVTKTRVNEARLARRKALGLPNTDPCRMTFYCVTVATDAINPDAYAGIDLTRDDHYDDARVLIDNMSMASTGFFFDNCRMQNIRSRGLLIKASGGSIQNCTFRNIGMSCAAILYEIYWGESGVSENVTVTRNLIDHTGYFKNQDRYAPIAIEGLGSRVDEDFLLYKNIQITHNVIRNRTTDFAIYVNSARDVLIKNNDFGDRVGGEDPENPTLAIHLNGAMNIEISGNKYSSLDLPVEEKIKAQHVKNIFGSDVEYEGQHLIPDQE